MRITGRTPALVSLLLAIALLVPIFAVRPAQAEGSPNISIRVTGPGIDVTATAGESKDINVAPGQQLNFCVTFGNQSVANEAFLREDRSMSHLPNNGFGVNVSSPCLNNWGFEASANPYFMQIRPQANGGIDVGGESDKIWLNITSLTPVAPLTITATGAVNDGKFETDEVIRFSTTPQTGEYAMIWSGPWGEFNSGTNAFLDWSYNTAGPQTVSVRVDKVVDGTWQKVAEGSVTFNVAAKAQTPRPSFVALSNPIWTLGLENTIAITVSNAPANSDLALLMSGFPGTGTYNPMSDPAVAKVRNGNILSLEVPFKFTNTGDFTIRIQMDAVIDGVWNEALQVENVLIRVPEPNKPVLEASAPVRWTKLVTDEVTLIVRNVPTDTSKMAIRIDGFPGLGTYNPWLDAAVVKQNQPDGSIKMVIPFRPSAVGRVTLTIKTDANLTGTWTEVDSDSLSFDVVEPVRTETNLYLSLVVVPARNVPVTSSVTNLRAGATETLLTAQFDVQPGDQVIWTIPGKGEYNSTLGHQRGEQPAPNSIKFAPQVSGQIVINVRVDRVVGGSWMTPIAGSITLNVAP